MPISILEAELALGVGCSIEKGEKGGIPKTGVLWVSVILFVLGGRIPLPFSIFLFSLFGREHRCLESRFAVRSDSNRHRLTAISNRTI